VQHLSQLPDSPLRPGQPGCEIKDEVRPLPGEPVVTKSVNSAFIIPIVFGEQINARTPEYALYGFVAFYLICLILNWWFYLRANAYVKNP